MKPILFLLPAAFAVAIALPAQADTVYKWVDQNGVTNYTTTPPPVAGARKVATINANPAGENRAAPAPGSEEERYWRQRREREAAESLREARLRQESKEQEEWRERQLLAQGYDEGLLRAAQDRRRQAAFDQCMLDQRPDCALPDSGIYVPAGIVVAARGPGSIFSAAPFSIPGAFALGVPPPPPPRRSSLARPSH
jgi:hypothetical protein